MTSYMRLKHGRSMSLTAMLLHTPTKLLEDDLAPPFSLISLSFMYFLK